MLHALALAAMLTTFTGDILSTCHNLGRGEHEHNRYAPSSCTGIALQGGAGMIGTVALLEARKTPLWAKVAIYGGLAGAHGWALHHNLAKR